MSCFCQRKEPVFPLSLWQGLSLSGSGFKAQHVHPERVVTEAIVNAVVRRDDRRDRRDRDVVIRLFDDRMEVDSGMVTLLNLVRPTAWDEVSHWIDKQGSIAHAELREIAKLDTLRASKMLAVWVEQGLLVELPGRGKRNTAYTKPARPAEHASLLCDPLENNPAKSWECLRIRHLAWPLLSGRVLLPVGA